VEGDGGGEGAGEVGGWVGEGCGGGREEEERRDHGKATGCERSREENRGGAARETECRNKPRPWILEESAEVERGDIYGIIHFRFIAVIIKEDITSLHTPPYFSLTRY